MDQPVVNNPRLTRSRCFAITIFPADDEVMLDTFNSIWDKLTPCYMIFGDEIAPTTERRHFQGYIRLPNPRAFNSLKKVLPEGTHIEAAHSGDEQNRTYCSKGAHFIERGECSKQGKRTDIEDAIDTLKLRGMYGVATDHPALFVKYSRGFSDLSLRLPQLYPAAEEREVIWCFGDTGTGKTRYLWQCSSNHETSSPMVSFANGFFQGLKDPSSFIGLDELRQDTMPWPLLLRILDRYPLVVNVKGSQMMWHPRQIVITSCADPRALFLGQAAESTEQLGRRLGYQALRFFKQPDGTSDREWIPWDRLPFVQRQAVPVDLAETAL